jgi:hypothetical protein
MDWFDVDTIIPELADINAVPFRFLRDAETVDARRKGREAETATAQITQALPGMAQMMKAASPEGTNQSMGQPV